MLEGKTVDVRVMEREELPLFQEWLNNPKFMGEFLAPMQRTRAELEKLESSFFLHQRHSLLRRKMKAKLAMQLISTRARDSANPK